MHGVTMKCNQSLYIMSTFSPQNISDILCKQYFYNISKFLPKDMAVFTVLEARELMTTKYWLPTGYVNHKVQQQEDRNYLILSFICSNMPCDIYDKKVLLMIK